MPSNWQLGRIEIEEGHACGRARLAPVAIIVASGHEYKLPREITEHRARQAFDMGLSVPANTTFEQDEEMNRRLKAALNSLTSRLLHDLGCHTGRAHNPAAEPVFRG